MLYKIYSALWHADPVLDILLLIVLFVRRRAATFPLFTLCTATDALMYILLTYGGLHGANPFSKFFRPITFTQATLSLLVPYELSLHVFRPTGIWAPDTRKPLFRITAASFLIAIFFALLAHLPAHSHRALMWRIHLFFSIQMPLMLVGMVALASKAGLPFKTHAARIIQALCFVWFFGLVGELIIDSTSRTYLARVYYPEICIDQFIGAACMVYWLVALWRDEPAPQPLPEPIRTQIHSLQQQTQNDLTSIRALKNG